MLVSSSPGFGHLVPLLSVARAAADRGHDVLVAAGASLGPVVERVGLRHVAMGPARIADVAATIPGIDDASRQERARLMYGQAFAGIIASAMADGVLELAATWRPDVVVHEDMETGSWIAAEVLGIPHVTIQAAAWRPRQRPWIAEPLNAIRAEHGMAPDPELDGHFGALWFTTRPASMRDPAAPLPAGFRELRPEPDDRAGLTDGEPTSWPPPARGRPRIAVTLGTVSSNRVDLLRPIVEGCAEHPVEVVVGLGADPATLGPVPGNVRVDRYVPMSDILPTCAAIVHHGGSGTTLAALAAGVPMVVIPIAADQFDNTEATLRTGAALLVDAGAVTADTVGAAVGRLLSEPPFGDRARAVAGEIAAMAGPDSALDAIEALV